MPKAGLTVVTLDEAQARWRSGAYTTPLEVREEILETIGEILKTWAQGKYENVSECKHPGNFPCACSDMARSKQEALDL